MNVKTYRARNLQEALAFVRDDLGPEASVLQTRDLRGWGPLRWLLGRSGVEVTASVDVAVPSRLPMHLQDRAEHLEQPFSRPTRDVDYVTYETEETPEPVTFNYREKFRDDLKDQITDLQSLVEDLCRRTHKSSTHDLPESLFRLFTDLIEADVSEELARELVERIRTETPGAEVADELLLRARMARMIESEIRVTGPVDVTPGQRRIVALVGPTGVGKTTTIAKLAANFRLREKRRVGLITVDTYRIAAVEQLRTYADIIDLPMEVVSTPKEMRAAVARLSNLDLILIDTAGRSPRDEVRIQELKSLLAEASADEVHLVLSSIGSATNLAKTAERFAEVGTTALLLTKLDESAGLGNLLPLLRASKLPLSYVTNGQNVPDDIQAADQRRLARMVLGMEVVSQRE